MTTAPIAGDAPAGPDPVTPPSPPEMIDRRLKVTSGRMWLGLLAFFALLVGGGVWSVYGKAADEVEGVGAMVPAGGFIEATAAIAGTVDEVRVAAGDHVADGQVVATVTDTDGRRHDITSVTDGTIEALLERRGSYVDAGETVAVIVPRDAPVEAVLYVGAVEGKAIQPGMTVYISPTTAPSSEYGSIVGTVTSIPTLYVTRGQLDLTLGSENPLSDELLGRGPGLEIGVALERADTPSGYRWSSSNGPAFTITSGTIFSGAVVIKRDSPGQQILGR